MTDKKVLMALVVVAIIAIGVPLIRKPVIVQVNLPESVLGAHPSNESTEPQINNGGTVYGKVNATSSSLATYTLTASDMGTSGSFYDTILFTKTGALATTTWTLPATSTVPFLPTPGQRSELCIRVATTTKTVGLTLAAGTGWDMETATTSLTGGGAINYLTILPGDTGCLKIMRQEATASTFDLTASFFPSRDSD